VNLFLTALVPHIAAGATAVVAGLLATTARKRPGRHPRAGTAYLYGMAVVFVTATVMAILRWRDDWHLFVIASIAFGLAMAGWWARRRRIRGWMLWHGCAMAGSYVALFTGFYVDNGPRLPVWERLPHLAYWLVPAAVGAPLTWRALVRNGAVSRRQQGGLEPDPPSLRGSEGGSGVGGGQATRCPPDRIHPQTTATTIPVPGEPGFGA
jgi:hypothetical protein